MPGYHERLSRTADRPAPPVGRRRLARHWTTSVAVRWPSCWRRCFRFKVVRLEPRLAVPIEKPRGQRDGGRRWGRRPSVCSGVLARRERAIQVLIRGFGVRGRCCITAFNCALNHGRLSGQIAWASLVPSLRDQFIEHRRVDRRGVSHHLDRRHLQCGQRTRWRDYHRNTPRC
jgi:hypothetical protein